MKKATAILSVLIILLIFMNSCMKDDMRPITEFDSANKGVFIVCEGNFMYGNASISYYSKNEKSVENTVFLRANGFPLGDVAQSLTIYDSTAWIVMNNSGKVYAIDSKTFKYKGKIAGLVSPRYMQFINPTKAYITDMYAKCIYVVNPQTYSIIKTINIDDKSGEYYRHSSEQIVLCNNKMFINSWSYDNKILVINTLTDELEDSIEVLKQPRKLVIDKNEKLWVLCDGGYQDSEYSGESGIVKIDCSSHQIEKTLVFDVNSKAIDMKINKTGDTIYYINHNIYRFGTNDESLPAESYIDCGTKNFYAIGLDPENYDLYVSDAVDYMQSGVVYRFSAATICTDTFNVGIIPNSFVFR